MGQQDRIVAFWQGVLEKIAFHDVDVPAPRIVRQSLTSNRSRRWQFVQRALQLWIALQEHLQERTSPPAQIQNTLVPAEVVCACQSQSVASGEGLHAFGKNLLLLRCKVEFAGDSL